jgi:geranylgeranyl transferase type-2 subunit beta
MLGKLEWIDREKLADFILSSQDVDHGGISDRPGNMTDVFHTFFGICGLSLMGYPGFEDIDPVFALPRSLTKKLGLQIAYQT